MQLKFFVNGKNTHYSVLSFLTFCLFICLFFQLSVIDPIKREITEARNAIDMGDYPRAIELLGRAIEVTC